MALDKIFKCCIIQVYNKSSKGEYNKKPGYGKLKNKSPNTSEESSTIEEASLSELKESSAKLTELENLLSKADDKSISKKYSPPLFPCLWP